MSDTNNTPKETPHYKYTYDLLTRTTLTKLQEKLTPLSEADQNEPRELYLTSTNRHTQPEHWLLMFHTPNAERCTFYDLQDGFPPSTYVRCRLENRRFEHWEFPIRHKIAELKVKDEIELVKAALEAKDDHCQRYVLAVVEILERKGLVREGVAKGFKKDLQPGPFEGPVRFISEREFCEWVGEWGEAEAHRRVLEVQGWEGDE